jgi:hypothetical protein
VERDRQVEQRDALRHRGLEFIDLEWQEAHVVDEVVEAPQVIQRGLLDEEPLLRRDTKLSTENFLTLLVALIGALGTR